MENDEVARNAARMLHAIVDAAPDLVFIKDLEGKYLFLNAAAARVKGKPAPEVLGRDDRSFFDPEFAAQLMATDRQIMASGTAREVEEAPVVEGERRTFLSLKAPYRDGSGQVVGIIGISRDVTDSRRVASELARAEARWQVAVDSVGDGIWDWDVVTGAVFFSAQWKATLGYEDDEVGGTVPDWETRVHPDDRPITVAAMDRHLCGEAAEYSCEHRMRTKSGEWLWVRGRGRVIERDPSGRPIRVVGVMSNIAAQVTERRRVEREALELERLAEIDDLTGVANRRGFTRALSEAWASAAASGELVHLALIDVDEFKRYNDTHGHAAGDRALRSLASIVARVPVDGRGVAARHGGDELALLLVGDLDLGVTLDSLRSAVLSAGLTYDGVRPVTISIGGVSGSAAVTTPGRMLREADRRMYVAKAEGRNRVVAG